MTGAAQNKLGELFVDIGVGGVGKTLKSLNSISASFLLTKNAAMQAVKPFINIGKEAMNSAVGIGKMAAALGTTTINAQKLQYYLNKYDSEGLEGSVASLQNIFTKLKAGYGGLDGQMAMSMGQLGLDWQKYSGSFEDTLQFIQDVKDRFQQGGFSENEKLMHLQNLGLQEWKYLFEKKDFDINESLRISDETFKNLQETSESINELKNNVDQLKKNVVSNITQHGGKQLIENLATATGTDENLKKQTFVGYKTLGQSWEELKTEVSDLFKTKNSPGLESINDNSLYMSSAGDSLLPASLPATATTPNINVNIDSRINTTDSNTQFEVLDIDVEPIQYTQAMQRNSN